MNDLGKLIKKNLIDKGMTQGELASRIGVSEKYLSRIVRGERGPGKYVPALARELNVPEETIRELAS